MNLQQNPQETYYSCPYCLTRITVVEESPKAEGEPEEKAQPKRNAEETKQKLKHTDKPASCNHHPGYLSERSSNEQIPDECLVCKDIVDCMLKKMRE
ncbi:MAG: hypothetical protein M1167_04310 [Chloroflexi bacterium]|nr:hypothetical protein [Chloroflexota bacterium]